MLMPLTHAHAQRRWRNAQPPVYGLGHRQGRRARLQRFHTKVASFNLLRVVVLGEYFLS